jgi:hypothetical protein
MVMKGKASSFMHGLLKPNIRSVGELESAVYGMEAMDYAPMICNGKVVPNRYGIVGKISGDCYGDVSRKYKIAQNHQVFSPVVEAVRENGYPVSGSIWAEEPLGGGFPVFRMALNLGAPVHIGDGNYYATIVVTNSFDGSTMAMGLSAFIRAICGNGMYGIKGACAEFGVKHNQDFNLQVKSWGAFINSAQRGIADLAPIIESASKEALTMADIEPMLRGAGILQREAVNVMDDLQNNTTGTLNRWMAYNAITKNFSHREKGGYKTNMEGLVSGARFLQEPKQGLIDLGDSIIQAENLKLVATP